MTVSVICLRLSKPPISGLHRLGGEVGQGASNNECQRGGTAWEGQRERRCWLQAPMEGGGVLTWSSVWADVGLDN